MGSGSSKKIGDKVIEQYCRQKRSTHSTPTEGGSAVISHGVLSAQTQANTGRTNEGLGSHKTATDNLVATTYVEKADVDEKNLSASDLSRDVIDKIESTARQSGGMGWAELLKHVADEDLWGEELRENRPKWAEYLKQAENVLRKPRKCHPQDVVDAVFQGDLGRLDIQRIPSIRSKVIVFISSTFTDTVAERNALMKDVYPYLRTLSRTLGMDFGAVDMRWGINEETSLEHGTAEMCIKAVDRCIRESAGPAFLAILGNKYGHKNFPSEIEQSEFEQLLNSFNEITEDITLTRKYFQLDTNAVPPEYVLRPKPRDDEEEKKWWEEFELVQAVLREAAKSCLAPGIAEKYFVSVTETELQAGIFGNELRESQAIVIDRDLAQIKQFKHLNRLVIDVIQNDNATDIDEEAQKYLRELKEVKVINALPDKSRMSCIYTENEIVSCRNYIKEACDNICERLTKGIIENYDLYLHLEHDITLQEILQHRAIALDKCSLFFGRELLLQKITSYLSEIETKSFVVYGESGTGKTALMAVCAKQARDIYPQAVLISRFLGTTSESGSARAVMQSVCIQIQRAFGRDPSKVPKDYKDLIPFFSSSLSLATPARPIIVFLDSLDQLSNEDFGKNLKWMSLKEELPPNSHIVVSTLPGQTLEIMKRFIPSSQCLEVKPLERNDGPHILDKMLAAHNRTLTCEQRKLVLNSFSKCPLPLYLRLAVDIALEWHSYSIVSLDEIAADIPGLITTLFRRLESRYGQTLVQHSLSYITAARNGLSVSELEDILSCDDEVLEEVFDFWLPPIRRIPQLLWTRIRNELGMYLVERGVDGVSAYSWYHRQFWETAEKNYLNRALENVSIAFASEAYTAIADYFEGKWYNGKLYVPNKISKRFKLEERVENRKVPRQPIVLTGNRSMGRQLNKRKLRELSHSLLKLKAWDRFEKQVTTLEFIEAKFEVGQGFDCISELVEASKFTSSNVIKTYTKFIGSGLSHLLREPNCVYQLASQQIVSNPVHQMFQNCDRRNLPNIITKDRNPSTVDDPCEMTLRGHTSGVRCCQYSTNGDMIVSTGEDGSMRIWDAYSGAEILTVSRLPGPTYPSLAELHHGDRPCCFSRNGMYVATGSEDGWLQLWDMAGGLVNENQFHSASITGIVFALDNSWLASCAKDKSVRFWSVGDYRALASVSLPGQAMAVDISPDGSKLGVAIYGGGHALTIVDTKHHKIITSNAGHTALNLCVSWSPQDNQIATAGDNSAVSLWSAQNGTLISKLTGHKGWIWCVRYTEDGTKLLSCSSDRSMKMWDVSNQSCIVHLGGHLHRLTCVSIHSTGEKFVTSSLDFSLKVWDFHAVASGKVPPVGGLHYVTLKVSPDNKVVASSQGWNKTCCFWEAFTNQSLGSASQHNGFINEIAFSPDSSQLVSVDTGHKGAYQAGAARQATVKMSSVHGGVARSLSVSGPSAVACANKYVVVGTIDSTVELFDMDTTHKLQIWSWSDAGSEIPTEEKEIIKLSCRHSDEHVAVAAGITVKIWKVVINSSGCQVVFHQELKNHDALMSFCLYSPKGNNLLSATITGLFYIWDVFNNYNNLHIISDHYSMIRDIAYSPQGNFVATVAVEMSLKVWDTTNNYKLKASWYGPINQLGFVDENVLIVGEATGNRKYLEFPL